MTAIVILAGGKSSRMKTDKLRLTLNGESLLRRAAGRFSKEFQNVYISGGVREIEDVGLPQIRDIYPDCGPLSGLHTALSSIDCEGVFLIAADMPFAQPKLAKRVIETAREADICCAGTPERPEPLFAYYSKRILPYVEEAIDSGNYKLSRLMNRVKVRYVDLEDSSTFFNVNTPEDYENAKNTEKTLDKM